MAVSLLKIAADVQLSLAAAVTVGATTATLSTASDEDGVALPAGKYGFTVDGDTSAKEYITCDLLGNALTNIQHISRQGAATTGFANYHRVGATVTITDWAILSRMLNNLNGSTGFDSGIPLTYDGDVAGLAGFDIPTVNYVLSVVNGGTVDFSQQVLAGQTAGENISVREIVYYKESDQKWWKVDADTSATFAGTRIGIAQSTVLADATFTVILNGTVTGYSLLTPGAKYYASATAGAITASIPAIPAGEVFVGWALTASVILFSPSPRVGPFVGLGNPTTANPFLTANMGGSVQSFIASGTWTKPAGARYVEVYAIGQGGGGGGGAGDQDNDQAGGGAGGGGGGYSVARFAAGALTDTVAVTVNTGGTGGAGTPAGVSAAVGTDGTAGSDSSFGTYIIAKGGGGGQGGRINSSGASTAGTGGKGAIPLATQGIAGGNGGNGNANGTAAASTELYVPTGGGGGGGSRTGTGAAGGSISVSLVRAGGTANGGAGNSAGTGELTGGTGGGGGNSGSGSSDPGIAGGAGGSYGGGGGGGGAAGSAGGSFATGGTGGNGGNGIVYVITY